MPKRKRDQPAGAAGGKNEQAGALPFQEQEVRERVYVYGMCTTKMPPRRLESIIGLPMGRSHTPPMLHKQHTHTTTHS